LIDRTRESAFLVSMSQVWNPNRPSFLFVEAATFAGVTGRKVNLVAACSRAGTARRNLTEKTIQLSQCVLWGEKHPRASSPVFTV
jgi:hypothetical protein